MTEYALVIDGQFRETRQMVDRPPDIPHKDVEWFPVVREEGEEFSGVIDDEYVIRLPAVEVEDPGLAPPHMIAAAFNLVIENGDISNIGGAFNLIAALYLDVGQYMLLFLQPEPDTDYFGQPAGGAPYMQVTDRGEDYLIVEARDGEGGAFVDPACFNIQVYRI